MCCFVHRPGLELRSQAMRNIMHKSNDLLTLLHYNYFAVKFVPLINRINVEAASSVATLLQHVTFQRHQLLYSHQEEFCQVYNTWLRFSQNHMSKQIFAGISGQDFCQRAPNFALLQEIMRFNSSASGEYKRDLCFLRSINLQEYSQEGQANWEISSKIGSPNVTTLFFSAHQVAISAILILISIFCLIDFFQLMGRLLQIRLRKTDTPKIGVVLTHFPVEEIHNYLRDIYEEKANEFHRVSHQVPSNSPSVQQFNLALTASNTTPALMATFQSDSMPFNLSTEATLLPVLEASYATMGHAPRQEAVLHPEHQLPFSLPVLEGIPSSTDQPTIIILPNLNNLA
ncbi:hypothetical protein Ciccas_000605 [Cichlidogyrus casuarinus]|uniref:Uncharacterized protein n=1 Tax=Cichlidogyrus casuarinus TaxID=1844966 RepID=A0ABD2QMG5_9PLAT